jgi:two-component system chemotaxis response regulator CheB
LEAAVAVVLYVSARGTSLLADILRRARALPAGEAGDGESIEPGRIYTARPDRHLLVERSRFRLAMGPPEHSARPAVDPLFRSAAEAFGPRTIGVVLSGSLADGTAGLAAIKDHGGWAMAEDPRLASLPGMPASAVEHVAVDVVGSCEELADRAALLVAALGRRRHRYRAPALLSGVTTPQGGASAVLQ